MDKLQHPDPLSLQGNLSENWRKWKQRFELYLIASGISDKDDVIQGATLLHIAGKEALELYNTFHLDNDGDKIKNGENYGETGSILQPKEKHYLGAPCIPY